jgi:NAD-dependent deacetylase
MKDETRQILHMIEDASIIFALTGAGVSTLSGIPDFRTDKSGVWDRFDQTKIFDIDVFHSNPALFYEFAREYIYTMKNVKPNVCHFLLADMERRGRLSGISTQNIDGLHQAAGSINVFELHGSPFSSHCIDCGSAFSFEETQERLLGRSYPVCDCGAPIKPDVVFYGEQLPEEALSSAMREAMRCDLLLVLGTSLVVYPAAMIPEMAYRNGAKIVLFNKTPTPLDHIADLIIRDDLKDACQPLLEHLRQT